MSNDIMKDWAEAKERADSNNLPRWSTSTKIYTEGMFGGGLPAARFDPADTNHEKGHMHLGNGEKLNLSEKDAVETLSEIAQRNMLRRMGVNVTFKVSVPKPTLLG